MSDPDWVIIDVKARSVSAAELGEMTRQSETTLYIEDKIVIDVEHEVSGEYIYIYLHESLFVGPIKRKEVT